MIENKSDRIFYIEGIDDDDYDEPAPDPVIYHWLGAGANYLVRNDEGLWLFRAAHCDVQEWTYYLPQGDKNPAEMTEANFDTYVTNRDFGRFIVLRIPLTRNQPHDLCHLCLAPNGNGTAIHEYYTYPFTWELEWSPGDIRTLRSQDMEGLCKRIFKERVNPILDDPYFSDEERKASQSIEFICGSEYELARVTTWIMHSEPKPLSETPAAQTVLYYATASIEGQKHISGLYHPQNYSQRIRKLTELAFEYNAFTGIYWEYRDMNDDHRSGWEPLPQGVSIIIYRPSEHERAEALLNLAEWLKGKVPESERQALLRPS